MSFRDGAEEQVGKMAVERILRIGNKYGLHARPAMMFVELANKFNSNIRLTRGPLNVDGKSIMELMMLAAEKDSEIILTADGPDAEEAAEALENLVKGNFFEE